MRELTVNAEGYLRCNACGQWGPKCVCMKSCVYCGLPTGSVTDEECGKCKAWQAEYAVSGWCDLCDTFRPLSDGLCEKCHA